jgi:hypothetical protein
LWDGQPLGHGPLAFIAFAHHPQDSPFGVLAQAAVASANTAFLLAPEQLSTFLAKHADAELVCYDAATWHWLLHDYLQKRGDKEALAILWDYSRDARLTDILLLDQLIRQTRDGNGTEARSLANVTTAVADEELPDQNAPKFTEAMRHPFREENAGFIRWALHIATVIRKVGGDLLATAETIWKEAMSDSRLPEVQLAPQTPEEEERLIAALRRSGMPDDLLSVSHLSPNSGQANRPEEPSEGDPSACTPSRQQACPFGVLGLGLEVQGAIAVQQVTRCGLNVDKIQFNALCQKADREYEEASARLYADQSVRACFVWQPPSTGRGQRVIERDASGNPKNSGKPFRDWLTRICDRLRDIHHCPATLPTTAHGEVATDPERWEPWTRCHRTLKAWRDLVRAARLSRLAVVDGVIRPTYAIIPRVSCSALTVARELGGPIFRPRPGNVFLVGTLVDLRTRCLTALCRYNDGPVRGNLRMYYYSSNPFIAEDWGEPMAAIAGSLYALATFTGFKAVREAERVLDQPESAEARQALRAYYRARDRWYEEAAKSGGGRSTPNEAKQPAGSANSGRQPRHRRMVPTPALLAYEQAEEAYREISETPERQKAQQVLDRALDVKRWLWERFPRPEATKPSTFRRWLCRTRSLLESVPLGLSNELLRNLLIEEEPAWAHVSAAELTRVQSLLIRNVVRELDFFLDLDLFNKIAEQLGEPTNDVIASLADEKHLGHLDARILHHLQEPPTNQPVWNLILRSRQINASSDGKRPSRKELVARLLQRVALTPAGRVVGPDRGAATGRQAYMGAADEFMKAVAYALVANGQQLAAITESQLVLEVPEAACSTGELQRLADVVQAAQEPLLGSLSAPVRWEHAQAW